MGRFDIRDDGERAKEAEPRTPAKPEAGRARVEQLPQRAVARTRANDDRDHALTLPRTQHREDVRHGGQVYRLRGSEVDLLERAARYRAVFTDDLVEHSGDGKRCRDDLRSLEQQGLVETRAVTRLRDGVVVDVSAVTPAGKGLLDDHRDSSDDRGQEYYGGWVKPAEIWHDASVFRMCREVEAEVEATGGRVRRTVLDDELKARAFRALHVARSRGGQDDEHHTIAAAAEGLHVENGRFVLPDARLEIEDADGSLRTVDLELVTEHYHRGHLGGKARAGFRMFSSGSSGAHGGRPQDVRLIERLLR